ncbi:MAG TPA: nicotinic acid mononucleotide adenylyltransferase [Dehalococcoidia bacterium]|nr:nicotinic acid mononucleotide adenylyltransferase [Dehalococcoidia bacterium]
MNIGLLGGTFDPIHNGHLAIVIVGIASLKLDRVLLLPAGQPWLKPQHPMASAEHRIEMVRLAIAGNPTLVLSTVETDRPGISYTVDTIAILRKQFAPDDNMYFLMGADSLDSFSLWKEPSRLIELCRLAVFTRRGFDSAHIDDIDRAVPGVRQRTVFVDMEPIDISSADIRRRIRNGLTIRNLVPVQVEKYIRQHGLYR